MFPLSPHFRRLVPLLALLTPILLLSLLSFAWASLLPRPPFWVDLYSGEPESFDEMLADLAGVQAVYLGELHTLPRHAAGQLQILSALIAKDRPVALALEQMESINQPALDRYARGEIDFAQLAADTHWAGRWSNYDRYRPLLEAARAAHAPIVALNARAEVIHEVGLKGLAGLAPALRRELPPGIDLNDPPYEKLLNLKLMVHASLDPPRLRRVFEAQVARDEAMAFSLASFLQSERGRGRQAVVICGGGHVSYGLGLPARVRRRLPTVTDRIVYFSESGELTLSAKELAQSHPIRITHQDLRAINRPLADHAQIK